MLFGGIRGFEIFEDTKDFFTITQFEIPGVYERFEDAKSVFAGTLLGTTRVSGGFGGTKSSLLGLYLGLLKNLNVLPNLYLE